MNELQALKDAKKTLEQIKKHNNRQKKWEYEEVSFQNFGPTYSFSNENLAGYYKMFDMKDKNVLTVAGSGDQVIDAILKGASCVDCFDSNSLSYYNLMLKLSAINSLSRSDFLKLYNLLKANPNRKNYYSKINDFLSDDIKVFWDFIFSKKGDLFRECFINKTLSLDSISYLSEENFDKIKDISCDISFNNIDVFDLPNVYDKKYDFINLSNIIDYIDSADAFIELVSKLKVSNLNTKGSILIGYSWKPPYFYSRDNYISDALGAQQIKINEKNKDSIFVYTKKG